MIKNLLLLIVIATLGYQGWKHFSVADAPQVLTPEQEVAALVEKSLIPAADLAALSAKYPKHVTQALKGKNIAVSGVLSKAQVLGVDSNDLALELAGTPQLKIMFHSNFGIKERWGSSAAFKFQKSGKEILATSMQKPSKGDDSKDDSKAYPQIDTSSETAALQSMVGAIMKAFGSAKTPGGSKNSGRSSSATAQKVICSEGDAITLRGEFRHISAGWVKCDLLELP